MYRSTKDVTYDARSERECGEVNLTQSNKEREREQIRDFEKFENIRVMANEPYGSANKSKSSVEQTDRHHHLEFGERLTC